MSSSTRALPPAPPSFPETKPSIYDTSTGLSSAGGHPPRIPSLPNDQTATDDGWGGLIGAEKPKTAQELAEEKKEGEELLRREKVLENRKSNASKMAQELHDLEARLAAAEEKERSLRGKNSEEALEAEEN